MAKQEINIGAVANDNTGDPLRVAMNKVNLNFTELYDRAQIPTQTGNSGKVLSTTGVIPQWIPAPGAYVLPTASGSVKGGVKVGTGLTVDPVTSIMSVTIGDAALGDLTVTGSSIASDTSNNTLDLDLDAGIKLATALTNGITLSTDGDSNLWTFDANGNIITPNTGWIGPQTHNSITFSDDAALSYVKLKVQDSDTTTVYAWEFKAGGSVIFPELTVNLHNGGLQSAQTLQFGNPDRQAVITGPTPAENIDAQRIIIQGQRGTGTGEGGDVYLWGGDAQTNGGDIKIYAGDADQTDAGNGGYINIDAGNGYNYGGNLGLTSGNSSEYAGQVTISGGNGGIDGGSVYISGGYGGVTSGNVVINPYGYQWLFTPMGHFTLPDNSIIGSLEGPGTVGFGAVNETDFLVETNSAGTGNIWAFQKDGTLSVPGNIVPNSDIIQDLGTPLKRFRDLYLSGTTITLGESTISTGTSGAVTFSGGLTTTTTETGITGIKSSGWVGGGMGSLPSTITLEKVVTVGETSVSYTNEFIDDTWDITVTYGWQMVSPPGPGGFVTLPRSAFTTTDGVITISGSYPIPSGGAGTWYAEASKTFGVGEAMMIPVALRPVVNGPGSFRIHVTGEPTDSLQRANFMETYDSAEQINIESLTLVNSGENYNITDLGGVDIDIYNVYSGGIVPLSSTVISQVEDETSIWGKVGGINVIGYYSDNRNNTDPAAGGNGGPFTWGEADDTPVVATWTDGTRTATLTYYRTLASTTQSPYPYESNTNYWYSFVVDDPTTAFTFDSDWTTNDFINIGRQTGELVPTIAFKIDYDNPTQLVKITNVADLNRFSTDTHHLVITFGDGNLLSNIVTEASFTRLATEEKAMVEAYSTGGIGGVAVKGSSTSFADLTVTGDLTVAGDIHVSADSLYLGALKLSTTNGSTLLVNDSPLAGGGGGVSAIVPDTVLSQVIYSPDGSSVWVAGGDITAQFPSGAKFYIAGDTTEYTVDYSDTIYSFTNVHLADGQTWVTWPTTGADVYTTTTETPTTLQADSGVQFAYNSGKLVVTADPLAKGNGIVKVDLQNCSGSAPSTFTVPTTVTMFTVSQNGATGQAQVTLPNDAPNGKVYTIKFTDKVDPANCIVMAPMGFTIDGSSDPVEINKNNGFLTVIYDSGSTVYRIINKDLDDVQPLGQQTYEFDGVNTTLTVTNLNFNLLLCQPAVGYMGSDGHTVSLPVSFLGQRLVIANYSGLCTLTVTGAIDGYQDVGPATTAELIYTNLGWQAMYGTTPTP